MSADEYTNKMGDLLDRALAKAPESPKTKKTKDLINSILHASNSRTRFERLNASEAKKMTDSAGKKILSHMRGKRKEMLLNTADGSTLLLERKGGGIVAVVVEGGTRVGGPKQAPVFITIGYVSNAYATHEKMVASFNKTATAKKQNKVASAFHKGHGGQARRMRERYIFSKEA